MPSISISISSWYSPSGSAAIPARMPASVRRMISSACARSVSRPNSAASRTSSRLPDQPAATWARRSPIIFSANRTLRRRIAKSYSFGTPSS